MSKLRVREVKRHSRWADQWTLGRGSAATPRDPMRYRERGPPKVTEGQVGDQDTCGLEQGIEAAHSGPGDSGVCLPSRPCPSFVQLAVSLPLSAHLSGLFPSIPLCRPLPSCCPPPAHLCFALSSLPLSLPVSDSVSSPSSLALCVCVCLGPSVRLSHSPMLPSLPGCALAPSVPPRPAQGPGGLSVPFSIMLSALFPQPQAHPCWVS